MATPLTEKALFLCVIPPPRSISLASESTSDDNEVPGVIKGRQSLRLRVQKLLVQGHVALLFWASPMHTMVQTPGKTNCLPHELENKGKAGIPQSSLKAPPPPRIRTLVWSPPPKGTKD